MNKIKNTLKNEMTGLASIIKNDMSNIILALSLSISSFKNITLDNVIINLILTLMILFVVPNNSKKITEYIRLGSEDYYFQIIGLLCFNVIVYIVIILILIKTFFF